MAKVFKAFFSAFITHMSQLFLKSYPQPSPPTPAPSPSPSPPSHDLDLEAGAHEHHRSYEHDRSSASPPSHNLDLEGGAYEHHRSSPSGPSPPSHDLDLEAGAHEHHRRPARPVAGHKNLDWTMVMITFCLASAIEIATLSVQTQSQLSANPNFYLLCFAVTLAFASLFVSNFIDAKYAVAAQVLDRGGRFFAVTAFFVAITIPFPLWVECIIWTIYAISLLAILICNRF